ncbi:hypothetical protein IFM89_011468 [Coptis chinensis]|uniref:Pentatricopeptide repeat-containing protein n=1 Tax=Coptis chinensis TaxID=261450 RepID=A0A835M9N9_9MAGN|nr:hypothetical protein IFM89_011468 [Coptis chinensis]
MDKTPPASGGDVSIVNAPPKSTSEPTASVQLFMYLRHAARRIGLYKLMVVYYLLHSQNLAWAPKVSGPPLAQRSRREKECISGRMNKRTKRNLESYLHNMPVSMSSYINPNTARAPRQISTNTRDLRHLGRRTTLEFFSWAGFEMGFCFEDSVIEYMADFLGREGRIKDALCLFEEMEVELNCKPDNFVCNNMLYVLCKKETSGEFIDKALMIFRKIESPDVYSYSNILVGLCKFGRIESAVEVFHEMCSANLVPTKSAVNFLIGQLCRLNTNEECLERVRVRNFRRPFTILVPNVGLDGGAILAAVKIFWLMGDLGLFPSPFIINQLISELCRLRKIDEAMEIFWVVEKKRLNCLEESYTIVIRALCDVRRVEEACQLFGQMLSQELKPKLVLYNSLICMLCKLGNVDKADRLFEIMNKRRCGPDNVTYTALIHGYGGAHNWEAAYGLLMEMLKMGWCPHFHTYSLVDKLLKEHGRSDLALKLEGKLDIQLLNKHCKAGQLEASYEKLSSMLERGFNLPVYARDAFIRAFQKAGKREIALDLLKKVEHDVSQSTIEPALVE